MTEQSLHTQLKAWYASEGDGVEVPLDDYIVDVVKDGLLIEIQTKSFSSIKKKLLELTKNHKVRLVHPLPYMKWIIRLNREGKEISKRRSPKRGKVQEVFNQLVYIPKLMKNPNFELEVLLINSEEYLIDDGKGSWRRRRWSIHDRKLINIHENHLFKQPTDFLRLIPEDLPVEFSARDLAKLSKISPRVAQKMVYCLRNLDLIEVMGKKKRANIYRVASIL